MPGGETSCSAQFRYGLTRSNVDPRVRVLCRKIDDTIWPSLQDGPKKSWRSTWSFSLHHVFAPHIFWSYLRPRGGKCFVAMLPPGYIYDLSQVTCCLWGFGEEWYDDFMVYWCGGTINAFSGLDDYFQSSACSTMTQPQWRRRTMGTSLYTLRRLSIIKRFFFLSSFLI